MNVQSTANRDSTAGTLLRRAGIADAICTQQTGLVFWEKGGQWGHVYTTPSRLRVTRWNGQDHVTMPLVPLPSDEL